MKQVINVMPDGNIEMTLKDSFFDSRIFAGHRKIERMTIIKFDEKHQDFYIEWIEGSLRGQPVGSFSTYEDAVTYEIDEINKMRLQGVIFNST